ncbi:MAG: hypothetical protein JNN15_04690 [Blastocatellia bacterium]|nr:hypothetical protein [Blastocatellia bacterium]
MNVKLFAFLLLLSVLVANTWAYQGDNFTEKEETSQRYQLSPGAEVDVSGFNGPVTIETTNSSEAEIYIVTSAKTRDVLSRRKVSITANTNSLIIKGQDGKTGYKKGEEVRHKVSLKLPRQINLGVKGINGKVAVGEVDGPVSVSGVNGSVDVKQANGYSDLSGINGAVKINFDGVGDKGVKVSGVNGSVEMLFTKALNADLNVSGINGNVYPELPNVTIEGKLNRNNFKAKIGSGGAPISVSGINGSVRLSQGRGAL